MRRTMEQKELLTHVWLQVGALHDMSKDKTVAVHRCKRGAKRLGVEWAEVIGRDRHREKVEARQIICKYLRDCGWTYISIGRLLDRDHATAMYSERNMKHLLEYDRDIHEKWQLFLNA